MGITHNVYSQENNNTFVSDTGLAPIYFQSWAPENPSDVKAVFQIIHGMAEHSGRYEPFARFLAGMGYAVFVHDQIGHGRSVRTDDDLGYFGDKNGWIAFKNDAHQVTLMAKKEYPGVPVFLFGHSMGSFVARSYIQTYADELAGAVICGTSGKNPAAGLAIHLAGAVGKCKGMRHRSKFIDNLAFAAYNKKFKTDGDCGFSWLSSDPDAVSKYNADSKCGFLFSAAGFRDLFSVLNSVSSKSWYDQLSKSLPVLLISGADDPVGSYGKGVTQVYHDLLDSGHDKVTLKLFDKMRHEILNEKGKDEVYIYIAQWLEKVLVHISK